MIPGYPIILFVVAMLLLLIFHELRFPLWASVTVSAVYLTLVVLMVT